MFKLEGWRAEAARLLSSFVIALVVTGLAPYFTSYFSQNEASKAEQRRQVLFEKAAMFAGAETEIIPLIRAYIDAINANAGINDARANLSEKLADEMLKSGSLKIFFGNDVVGPVADYQKALDLFLKELPKANSPTTMYAWAIYFEQVLAAKQVVTETLYSELGATSPS